MAEDDKAPLALVQITDVLGMSGPAKQLIEAIVRGVGEWAYPWQTDRKARADAKSLTRITGTLKQEGLSIEAAELSLEDRATIRVIAQFQRQQQNREAVALQAIEEFKSSKAEQGASDVRIDLAWLDRFWRLAEDASEEDFQSLWGRILARQTAGQASYSARCLETLSTLSRTEAKLLERLARVTMCVERPGVGRDFSILQRIDDYQKRESVENSLSNLNRELLNAIGDTHSEIFGPIGIFVESGWAYVVLARVRNGSAQCKIGSASYRIDGYPEPLPSFGYIPTAETVSLGSGIQFSPVGAEIIGLLRVDPNPDYVRLYADALSIMGLSFNEAR
jgi:hypothetical protein